MSSYRAGKEYVALYLRSHFPKGSKCLDVGCCEGFWYDMLSDWFDMDGIEVWRPNVNKYLLYDKYTNLFVKDIMNFTYPREYDVVIFGDIIEHLEVEQAQAVIESAKQHSKEVIVAVPYLYPQGDKDGNKYEIHKQPDLTEKVFDERYPGFVQLWPHTKPYPIQTEIPYGYYKLARTEWNVDKMNAFAVNEIYENAQKPEPSTTDYLKLLRGCLDYTMMATTQRSNFSVVAPDIISYYRFIRDKMLNGELPSFMRFWKDFYYLLTFIPDATPEEKKEAILQRFNPNNMFDQSKYLFEFEPIFVDWSAEYALAAADIYYCTGKEDAKKLNDKALELNPAQPIAVQNAKFYV